MNRTRRRLLAGVILASLTGGGPLLGTTRDLFDSYEFEAASARFQTIVPGHFLERPTAEIAVLFIDEADARRLRMFAVEGDAWAPVLEATLRPSVSFVDVANIGGRDRLITLERGRANWFDTESATERELVRIPSSYDASPEGLRYGSAEPTEPFDAGEILQIDVTRDLNGDGLDDLILPEVDGFRVFVQQRDGSFSDPQKLGPPEPFRDATVFDDTRSYGEVGVTPLTLPWYLSRVHELDYDLDGRRDLVFWHEDHFEVHLQDERGMFSPAAETFTVDVPFDSDGTYSLIFAFGGRSRFSLITGLGKRTSRTVLREFRDVDGDGVVDLVTMSLEGRSVLRLRSGFNVHYGVPTERHVSFSSEVGTTIRPTGKFAPGYASQWLEDFDGDGRVDVLYGGVQTGAGSMIRAIFNTSLTLWAELYRLDDGDYPEMATARRKMRADIDYRGGRDAGFFPGQLVGDVNGDGSSDLLVGRNREELLVFLGGPGFLAQAPRALAVTLPGDERNSRLVDLNRDGKQDVLLHHVSETEPHRVRLLISR